MTLTVALNINLIALRRQLRRLDQPRLRRLGLSTAWSAWGSALAAQLGHQKWASPAELDALSVQVWQRLKRGTAGPRTASFHHDVLNRLLTETPCLWAALLPPDAEQALRTARYKRHACNDDPVFQATFAHFLAWAARAQEKELPDAYPSGVSASTVFV